MIDGKRVLTVIIARAGSKGLPGKNARMLAGRPMIAHSIGHARESSLVDRIIVSTDGESIAKAARENGADVVDRPADLAGDTATVDSAVRHAVESLGDPAHIIVLLYGNVPVRPRGLIDRAVRALAEHHADSVQSYAPVGKHHPYWMVKLDADGRVSQFIENTVYRRQDLPPLLLPDGGVIAVTRESLFTVDPAHPHAFLGTKRHGIVNEEGAVIDIDHAIDLAVAEAMLLSREPRHEEGRSSP